MQKSHLRAILIVIAVLGALVSIYLINNHYVGGGSACDISQTISCSLANGSIYSKFLGIPVAILGLVWFLVVLYLAYSLQNKSKTTIPLLRLWGILGIPAIAYFIYAEISVRALCLACTVAHVLILITAGVSLYLFKQEPQKATLKQSIKREIWFLILVVLVMLVILLAFNWKYWFVY